MSELDNLIKSSLQTGIDINEADCENSYIRLKNNIRLTKVKRYPSIGLYAVNLRKAAVITICSLICVAAILVGSSNDVKAMALDAFNTVKMLFVTEKTETGIEIVQKPSSNVMFQPGVFKVTYKTEAEIEKLIGYPVIFPNLLDDSFELQDRHLLIGLEKEIPYDDKTVFMRRMETAIENQDEFNELSPYRPFRGVSCLYKYTKADHKYGVTFQISSWPISDTPDYSPNSNIEEVKIGDVKGYWINVKYPEYPFTLPGEDPMTFEPTIKDDFNRLSWLQNGRTYSLHIIRTTNVELITKDDAIRLAEEFINAQPK